MEFFGLSGDEGPYRPLGKLECLHSKKKCFLWKNGLFLTSFRGKSISANADQLSFDEMPHLQLSLVSVVHNGNQT